MNYEKHGTFTTEIIKVDIETGEILEDISNYNFIKHNVIGYEKRKNSRGWHTNRIIEKLYRRAAKQGELFRID